MREICRIHQEAIALGQPPPTRDHDTECSDCASFRAVAARLEPPADLVGRTLERVKPLLHRRRAARRALVVRLSLAGVFSLPIILALDAVLLWATHAALSRILSPAAGLIGTALVGGALLLVMSLAYGSLPLLASLGLQLRERTA